MSKFYIIEKPYKNVTCYVISQTNTTAVSDIIMSASINMSPWKYRTLLANNFNAIVDNYYNPTTTFYEQKHNAEKALDWYESKILMNYLINAQQ